MKEKNGVIILSGGLDSTTLLYYLLSQGIKLHALSFKYGQKHSKEIECAKKICRLKRVEHRIVDISFFGRELAYNSSLTSPKKIPNGYYSKENMKSTVVPFRNGVMLSLAVAYAENLGIKKIYYGGHKGDHYVYPDTRKKFVTAISKAAQEGTFNQVVIESPFSTIDKEKIVTIGTKLAVDYTLTWSCYKGQDRSCGRCGTCVERVEAFYFNNLIDPLMTPREFRKAVKYLQKVRLKAVKNRR